MIHLEKDQGVLTELEYAVSLTGDYEETDMVECYRILVPEQKVNFYALFCKTGNFPVVP